MHALFGPGALPVPAPPHRSSLEVHVGRYIVPDFLPTPGQAWGAPEGLPADQHRPADGEPPKGPARPFEIETRPRSPQHVGWHGDAHLKVPRPVGSAAARRLGAESNPRCDPQASPQVQPLGKLLGPGAPRARFFEGCPRAASGTGALAPKPHASSRQPHPPLDITARRPDLISKVNRTTRSQVAQEPSQPRAAPLEQTLAWPCTCLVRLAGGRPSCTNGVSHIRAPGRHAQVALWLPPRRPCFRDDSACTCQAKACVG
jgi:hypothetical protein